MSDAYERLANKLDELPHGLIVAFWFRSGPVAIDRSAWNHLHKLPRNAVKSLAILKTMITLN